MKFHDPIPLAPFLTWAQQRQAAIARQLDAYPAMPGSSRDIGSHTGGGVSALERLVVELGWPLASGTRRLHRWRCESLTGQTERATVETALDYAGVDFDELYPDLPPALPPGRKQRRSSARCEGCDIPMMWPAPLCGFCMTAGIAAG